MKDLAQFGRILFIFAIGALGIQAFICSAFIFELEPMPSWIHAQVVLANLTGFFLVAVSIGLAINKLARVAALSLGMMLLLWVLFFHLRLLVPHPASDLSFAFETLALSGVAWTLVTPVLPDTHVMTRWTTVIQRASKLGWYAFGISLLTFCIVNFIYHNLIAGMIPDWIPAHQFWAYFTGIASLAAGISILTGIQARLALTLLGIMYGSWVLVIHIPYLAVHSNDRGMWTDMFITLALSGGAWLLIDSVPVNQPGSRLLRSLLARINVMPHRK
ncbi:MAG: hypothetical protein ACRETA_07140 [Gammaproteobacteria bacterium]